MKSIRSVFSKNKFYIAGAMFLILLAFLIILVIRNAGHIRIVNQNRDPGQISPLGSVSFEFSRDVDPQLVDGLWEVQPQTAGRWVWQDARHATWYASTPLPAQHSIVMTFHAGKLEKKGEKLDKDQSWQASVRQPQIAVIETVPGQGQELFAIDLEGAQAARQIGSTHGKLDSFTPSPDGNQIILDVQNDKGGIDLWSVNRDGSDQHLLLDCGSDRCSAAAWSPDSRQIAFMRESSGEDNCGPRIWLLSPNNSETKPLFDDSQKTAYSPLWSPDGKWLSVWNKKEGGVQIINPLSGEIILLKSSSGDSGCWSADGKSLYYTNLTIVDPTFRNVILKADIDQGTIQTVLDSNINDDNQGYDSPACHPSENRIAVSIQPNARIPGKQLAIFDADNGQSILVTNDLTRFPSHYAWNPGGEYLLYQMNEVNIEKKDIEIWVRDEATGNAQLIIEGAHSPAWLP